MAETIKKQKAESIIKKLLADAAGVQYGSVEVVLKIHAGRVKDVVYSSTVSNREAAET